MTSSRIIVDRLPGYTRTALIKGGILTDLFIEDADDPAPRPGAVVRARVERAFPDHHRASLDIGGLPASRRIRDAARHRERYRQIRMCGRLPRSAVPQFLWYSAGRWERLCNGLDHRCRQRLCAASGLGLEQRPDTSRQTSQSLPVSHDAGWRETMCWSVPTQYSWQFAQSGSWMTGI